MKELGIVVVALLIVFSPVEALAYLDPGTGSYVVQMAIAGAVSAAFAIRIFWGRLKDMFHNIFKRDK
ncbi:MAG: hypothetical protein JRI70_05845 [Deltaproteobacteria bacterium]|nr:hypothetical protein [Deltaproteobacteria bacterium]MBW2172471.1 hypothetical protein [Deltaproteobacteria bacterium]